MKKIKNIIFDVGNVLFKYYPEHIISALLPKTNNKDFYLEKLFLADIWQLLDRGDLDINSATYEISNKHSLTENQKNNIRLLINDFYKHLILDKDMQDLFITCTKFYNVYILSNFQSQSFSNLKKDFPFLNLAKSEVVSANVKMMKPELGIYHYLLSQEKIIPEESVFIDDMLDNVNAANSLLINTIHHKSYKNTLSKLHKLGIKFQ